MDHATIIKTPIDKVITLVLFGLSCIGSERERFKSKFTKAPGHLKRVQKHQASSMLFSSKSTNS